MTDTITPTQADRDAADYVGTLTEERRLIVAEAFARHRIAAYEAGKLEAKAALEALTAENERLRGAHGALLKRMVDLVALTPPDPVVIDHAALAGKAEQ